MTLYFRDDNFTWRYTFAFSKRMVDFLGQATVGADHCGCYVLAFKPGMGLVCVNLLCFACSKICWARGVVFLRWIFCVLFFTPGRSQVSVTIGISGLCFACSEVVGRSSRKLLLERVGHSFLMQALGRGVVLLSWTMSSGHSVLAFTPGRWELMGGP